MKRDINRYDFMSYRMKVGRYCIVFVLFMSWIMGAYNITQDYSTDNTNDISQYVEYANVVLLLLYVK